MENKCDLACTKQVTVLSNYSFGFPFLITGFIKGCYIKSGGRRPLYLQKED